MQNNKSKAKIKKEHFFMFFPHDGDTILCPYHPDNHTGSVFFVDSKHGNTRMYCRACECGDGKSKSLWEALKHAEIHVEKKLYWAIKNRGVINKSMIAKNYNVEICNSKNGITYDKTKRRLPYKEHITYINKFIKYKETINNSKSLSEWHYEFMKKLVPFLEKDVNEYLYRKNMLNVEFLLNYIWIFPNEVDIPVYNKSGEVFNLIMIRDEYENKYRYRWSFPEKSDEWDEKYPIYWEWVEKNIKDDTKYVFITEGVKDAFNLNLLGYLAITFGGVNSYKKMEDNKYLKELVKRGIKVVVCIDNDRAGKQFEKKWYDVLKTNGLNLVSFKQKLQEKKVKDVSDYLYKKVMEQYKKHKIYKQLTK